MFEMNWYPCSISSSFYIVQSEIEESEGRSDYHERIRKRDACLCRAIKDRLRTHLDDEFPESAIDISAIATILCETDRV